MSQEYARTDRVAELLRREIAELLGREIKDPRVSGITVTGVSLSRNFAHATVYVSVLDTERMPAALTGLKRATGFLRHELGARLNLRGIPRLSFKYDDSEVRATRVDELIARARREDDAHPADDKDNSR